MVVTTQGPTYLRFEYDKHTIDEAYDQKDALRTNCNTRCLCAQILVEHQLFLFYVPETHSFIVANRDHYWEVRVHHLEHLFLIVRTVKTRVGTHVRVELETKAKGRLLLSS